MKTIILLGVFRSGTNYAKAILEMNYSVSVAYDLIGWKHGLVPTYSNQSKITYPSDPVLVVIKDPFAVLASWFDYIKTIKRNIKTSGRTFSEFIHSPVVYRNDFSNISPEYYFSNPVQMWNSVVWNHISFANQTGGLVFRYEDMLKNPKRLSEKIAEHFLLKTLRDDFIIPENVTKNMSGAERPQDKIENYCLDKKFEKKEFFLQRSYLNRFSKEDIIYISKELSQVLLQKTGYTIPSPNVYYGPEE